tara:strand:- start:30 stop:398 length:369 start_codon:yes stop_codon:yes gene_type:complete
MDKENLQTKVEALQDNLKVKHDELTEVQQQLNVARNELANAGKPELSADKASGLVDLLQGMFHDILNDFDTTDLDVEFGIGYDNRIELENVDMSAIEVHACDIENVLRDIFCITPGEESDNS